MAIIVSGCPRSGTSLMMQILYMGLGEDRIFGDQFPQERALRRLTERQEKETLEQFGYRKFVQTHDKRAQFDLQAALDLNPKGFWESPFVKLGLRYLPGWESKYREVIDSELPMVVKTVSPALAKSDPSLVTKVIFLVRHPREVAKSQERLRRELWIQTADGRQENLYEDKVIHSPKMFVETTIQAMMWIERNPDIPVRLVSYDDIVNDPRGTIEDLERWIDEPGFDVDAAVSVVDPLLKRSHPDLSVKSNLWGDAEKVYRALIDLDFEAARKLRDDPRSICNRESRAWVCSRTRLVAMEGICLACRLNAEYRQGLKVHAERKSIPWRTMPCAYEVAYDLDHPLISIDESVKKNHWIGYPVSTEEESGGAV